LEKHDLKPEWRIFSRNYGTPPAFNIFPDVLRINYEPAKHDGTSEVLSFERLKAEVGHPAYCFQYDFALAKRLFTKYFQFPHEVMDAVEGFFSSYAEQRILGLHYRGTDKVLDMSQTNPVTPELLLQAARDLLEKKGDVDLVFLSSDEDSFIAKAKKALPAPVVFFAQRRKASRGLRAFFGMKNHEPLFRNHEESENTRVGWCAVIDSLLLSRCHYLLKCQSALSAWSKVWNPGIEAYRIAAFKHDWFPDAFIPLYQTDDTKLRSDLVPIQKGEVSLREKMEISLPVSAYLASE